jgi:hypothetical protein
MKVFRNKHFTERNYECTNIVACVPVGEWHDPSNEHYAPADESLLVGLTALWVEGGMQYYGYL